MPLHIENIARIAHDANRSYCRSIGDETQLPWENAADWQQKSAISGVQFAIANPSSTPEDGHANWLKEKLADGWKVGPVKDPLKKEHPCCVPYDQLPPEQKVKDVLYQAVVKALIAQGVIA